MNQRGFSLLEVLLSVAIIGVLMGLSLPLYQGFQNRNDLELTSQNITSMLRRAQAYARGINGNSQWGVRVQAGSAVLFKGNSYASRDTAYDETAVFSSSFGVSGMSEILFSKLLAAPNNTGSITLTNDSTNDTRTITINAEGMVSH